MKKGFKKLTLHRETLLSLEDFRRIAGGEKTIDATYCVSNCYICYRTDLSNCC
jgi:hypothetical protein